MGDDLQGHGHTADIVNESRQHGRRQEGHQKGNLIGQKLALGDRGNDQANTEGNQQIKR